MYSSGAQRHSVPSVGSTERQQQKLWVHDGEQLVLKDIEYVPGLYKIFDEILVNAADNKVRDPKMNRVEVNIDPVRAFSTTWPLSCVVPGIHILGHPHRSNVN